MKQLHFDSNFLGIPLRLIHTASKQLTRQLTLSDKRKREIDFVSGIPGIGTVLAVLLAMELKKPLLIKYGADHYSVDIEQVKKFADKEVTPLVEASHFIATTDEPLSMIIGIIMAKQTKKTFIFVPRNPKIDLVSTKLKRVAILIHHPVIKEKSSYVKEAIETLKNLGIDALKVPERNTTRLLTKIDIIGKKDYGFGRGGVVHKKWFKKFK